MDRKSIWCLLIIVGIMVVSLFSVEVPNIYVFVCAFCEIYGFVWNLLRDLYGENKKIHYDPMHKDHNGNKHV